MNVSRVKRSATVGAVSLLGSAKTAGVTRLTRGVCAAALGVAAWSTLVEPRLFTLRRHTLPVLPSGAAPLRVLQLSDLHLAPWQHRKIDWVRSLAELRPDLVVLTGDLMGAGEKESAVSARVSAALTPIRRQFGSTQAALLHALEPFARTGVATVFVHGSNDYYGPLAKNPFVYLTAPSRLGTRKPDLDNAALTRGFIELGFTDLNNRAARLVLRGTPIDLIGLNDPHIHYDDVAALDSSIAELPPLVGKATAGANPSELGTAPVRIGVVHAPYQQALGQFLDRGASAILAGHTHGGQVRVPGVGALTSNCDLSVKQARGLSVWYDAQRAAFLNVSAGLGASIYAPVRFACRPEASLLTLEAAH